MLFHLTKFELKSAVMVLYEAYRLKPVMEVEVLMNALFKGPVLYIFRSEMNALVTLSNVWNAERDKECFGEALYCGFSTCGDMSDLDLYFCESVK